MTKSFLILLIFVPALVPTAVWAQASDHEPEIVTAPVTVRATPLEDARKKGVERVMDTPSFVTPIDVDESAATAESITDVLAKSVGVHVRSLGGLGSFSAISVRGAAPGQTAIFVDGVPVSRMAYSLFDLSSLERGGFSRIDVYRGGVPVDLGGTALGGAINFVTALGPRPDGGKNRLVLGTGSYGMKRALAERRDEFWSGRGASALTVSYSSSVGDFDYFDDNRTPLNLDDDSTSTRINNGFSHVQASGRVRVRTRSGATLEFGNRLTFRQQGVAGPVGVEAVNATLRTWRDLADATLRLPSAFAIDALDLVVRAHVLAERQLWRDPDDEVGFGAQDTTSTTIAGGMSAAGSLAVGERQLLTASLEGRGERFVERDRLVMMPSNLQGTRFSGAVSLADEVMLADDDLVLVPSVRVDSLFTRATKSNPQIGEEQPPDRNDLFWSPRAGVRWRVLPAVVVKANGGRYARPPTLIEVFGDRGFVVGNPQLLPETGWSADLGFVLAPQKKWAMLDRLYVESAAFYSRATDLIAFVPTATRVARAVNLRDVTLWGQEVAASVRAWKMLTVSGNVTFLNSRQDSELVSFDGKKLPGRPQHEVYLRADFERSIGQQRKFGGYVDFTYGSGSFIDSANLNQIPARRFVGLGLRATVWRHLAINVEVKNLFDETVETIDLKREVAPGLRYLPRAISDVLGYPLPGRRVFVGAEATF